MTTHLLLLVCFAGNLLGLPVPYGEAFRRMIDCPAVLGRLRWMRTCMPFDPFARSHV